MRTRLAAWLVTGPAGHTYAAAADLLALLVRLGRAALRRRMSGRRTT